MNMERLKAYELVEERGLDFGSVGCLLRHRKTGARVVLLSNSDANKVFYIGFATPPGDNTGAAHIVEHTVLCGSERFPVKDPFVELAKGSLNTFLNAMTYPDKTLYPVASTNEVDFKNLMHVYLDAVFFPNIYQNQEIFSQEGWHYEMERAEDPLKINGVVYNEMKGAYSSPEGLLGRQILRALYPDNAYGYSAAGEPAEIPELTYSAFLEFHRRFYHPSNSYIYLYGDLDMEERLLWMDREYLSRFDYRKVDASISLQKPFDKPEEVQNVYSLSAGEPLLDHTYLSVSYGVDTALNEKHKVAFAVLEYVLLKAPGAPLKKALLDAGIGKDVSGVYRSGVLQPYFSIIVKNSNVSQKEDFLRIVREALLGLAEGGLDREAVRAGLCRYEFDYREADFGRFPKGLLWGIHCMESWLYDDGRPFQYFEALPVIRWLKEQIDTGYFEGLIRRYLLENPHQAVVILTPEHGYNTRMEQKLLGELAERKASFSQEELTLLVEETARLRRYQEEPSTQEELRTIPLLSRADLKREPQPLLWEERILAACPALFFPVESAGITYLRLIFDAGRVAEEDVPYLGILKAVLGQVDTAHYSYQELDQARNLSTGGISGTIGIYRHVKDPAYTAVFELRAKALTGKVPEAVGLMGEILTRSRLTDGRRIHEILSQLKAELRESISSDGDSFSSLRAMSGFSGVARYQELTGGLEFYRLVSRLEEHYEEERERLAGRLSQMIEQLFCKENLRICVGGQEEGYEAVRGALPKLLDQLWPMPASSERVPLACRKKKEGFPDASQVQYVSRAGNFRKAGFAYTGALRVLEVILGYEYLWQEIRVKGGAYGCKASFYRNGDSFFSSYRDPNLEKTNRIYEGCSAYLKEFTVEERDMTKYVIGAVSSLDRPLTPAGQVSRALAAYFGGLTWEALRQEREQVLAAGQEEIRALADLVAAVMEEQALCVIGNEDRLWEEQHLFDSLETIS